MPIGGQGSGTPLWRRTAHTYVSIQVTHLYLPFSYNPSMGPVASIDYSYYLKTLTPSQSASAGMAFALLIRQGGVDFMSTPTDLSGLNTNWTLFSHTTLTPTNFVRLSKSGPDRPDFSCKGGAMQFGYVTSNSSGGSSYATMTAGIDDWSVNIKKSDKVCGCCPPWNSTRLADMLVPHSTGGLTAPYNLVFTPTATLTTQMNAYVNYLKALGCATSISLTFSLYDGGTGPNNNFALGTATPPPPPPPLASGTVTWTGSGSPTGLFTSPLMNINQHYRIETTITFSGGTNDCVSAACLENWIHYFVKVDLPKVVPGGSESPRAILQITLPDGGEVERPIEQGKQ